MMEQNLFIAKAPRNTMVHIALAPDGTPGPMISAELPFGDSALICSLLCTEHLSARYLDRPNGEGYLFLYDGSRPLPCSSVMIWRYHIGQHERVIQDMRQQDLPIVPYAINTFLH